MQFFAAKRNSELVYVCGDKKPERGGNQKTASTEVVSDTDIAVYPVPFKEVINVDYKFDYTSNVQINVFDMRGNHLRTYSDRDVTRGSVTTLNIDFALKANQTYIVQVVTDREKFVKHIVSGKKK